MNNHKGWIDLKRKAEDPPTAPPASTAPAPQVPLEDADKNRQPPPPNPTGIPDAKPMPMSELLRLLEMASKSLIDAGLDIDKSSAGLRKVKTMGGISESERQIIEKTNQYANTVDGIKDQSEALAKAISDYRDSLASKGVQGWLDSK